MAFRRFYPRYRRYARGRRFGARPRRLPFALRQFRAARRSYPSSKWGYTFIPRSADTLQSFGESYKKATEAQRALRQQNRYYGRGKYSLKQFGRDAWHFGKPILRQAGAVALDAAKLAVQQGLSGAGMYTGNGMYTGTGEYESNGEDSATVTNDLVSGGTPSVAQFASAGDESGALAISNREYLGDIYGNQIGTVGGLPIAFNKQVYNLNPGLEKSFPWLSQLASNYEEYEFKQLMFTFKSTVADINSNNGQVGTVIMATTYNANAADFIDKAGMMQYAHASSLKVTDDGIHGVECDPSKLSGSPGKFVRYSDLDLQDLNQYDHGKFQIAIANTPSSLANNSIGELWVSYTLVLRKPKIVSAKALTVSRFLAVTTSESNTGAVMSGWPNIQHVLGGTKDTTGTQLCLAKQNSLAVEIQSAQDPSKAFIPTWLGPHYSFNGTRSDASRPANHGVQELYITTVPAMATACRFPASFAGAVELRIRVEIMLATTTTWESTEVMRLNPPIFFGNIQPIRDVYASTNEPVNDATDNDRPSWFTRTIVSAMVPSTFTYSCDLVCHVYVSPATNGSDNGWYYRSTGDTGVNQGATSDAYGLLWNISTGTDGTDLINHKCAYTLKQSVIEMVEYNTTLNTSPSGDGIKFVKPDKSLVIL